MYNFYIELFNIDKINKIELEKLIRDILDLSDVSGNYKIVKIED